MGEEVVTSVRGSEFLYDALINAGVDLLIGLPGTQTQALDETVVERDEVEYVMARHETAIPHVAWGYFEAGGGIAATITVPGPGDTNASHGLKNALDDNVPLVHVSPIPDHEDFGRHPIHELEHETFDHVVKTNITVTSEIRLREEIERGIQTALTPPTGPVRLGIPSGLLESQVTSPPADVSVERTEYQADEALAEAAQHLASSDRPLLYVGGGVRRSEGGSDAVSTLVSVLDAPVAASYKGKGVFPEDDDHFLGVTGGDLPAGARAVFESADVVLALGTNFDGPNTDGWSLPMGETLIHVDIDPAEIGASYDPDLAIVADATDACEKLVDRLQAREVGSMWDGSALATAVREEYDAYLSELGLFVDGPPVPSPAVLRTVRDAVPRETIVTTDIGGHRIWSKNLFRTYDRETFVTAGSWAGMGVGLPSAIGAKLARPSRPVLTLSGDGSLLMCSQELHTAAEYDIDLTVVLFNDADYGIISKAMPDDEAHRFGWSSPDWVTLAEAYGCSARRVRTRNGVRDAIEWALDTDGPTLVDVDVEGDEPTPFDAATYETSIEPMEY